MNYFDFFYYLDANEERIGFIHFDQIPTINNQFQCIFKSDINIFLFV